MKTVETKATVTSDGRLIAHVPADISPGEHPVVLVIECSPRTSNARKSKLEIRTFPMSGWSRESTFRREDIYGPEGR